MPSDTSVAEAPAHVKQPVYYGHRRGRTTVDAVEIYVDRDGVQQLLRHRVYHSPTGMNWGYGGSGPADLARSILADYLGFVPAMAIYQDFKWQFVARVPEAYGWRITGQMIEDWLIDNHWREKPEIDQCWYCGFPRPGTVLAEQLGFSCTEVHPEREPAEQDAATARTGVCSRGWGNRCPASKGPRCTCRCSGANHGGRR